MSVSEDTHPTASSISCTLRTAGSRSYSGKREWGSGRFSLMRTLPLVAPINRKSDKLDTSGNLPPDVHRPLIKYDEMVCTAPRTLLRVVAITWRGLPSRGPCDGFFRKAMAVQLCPESINLILNQRLSRAPTAIRASHQAAFQPSDLVNRNLEVRVLTHIMCRQGGTSVEAGLASVKKLSHASKSADSPQQSFASRRKGPVVAERWPVASGE